MKMLKKHNIVFTEKFKVCENTILFKFNCCDENYSFKAGQFAYFTIPDKNYEDDKGNTRAFSFAGSPLKKGVIEICARLKNSKFTSHLNSLESGSQLFISEAKGKLNIFFEETESMVISAGGLGITPVRSFLEDTIIKNSKKSIILIYANKSPASGAFLSELFHMKNLLHDFNLIPVFETNLHDNPDFEKGKINYEIIRKYAVNPEKQNHLILGPPGMVSKLESELMFHGIPEKNIFTEKY